MSSGKDIRSPTPANKAKQTEQTPERKRAQEEFLIVMAQFLTDKKISTAKEGFLRVLKIDPTFPQPRFNLGVLTEAEGDREEARKWFDEYLKLDFNSSYAKAAKAKLARLRVASATHAQSNRSAQYGDYLARARRLISAGFLKEAIAEFDQAARWMIADGKPMQ